MYDAINAAVIDSIEQGIASYRQLLEEEKIVVI
jgi:hypothetical protein